MKEVNTISQDFLRERFDYKDGQLINKTTNGPRAVKGTSAGYLSSNGYVSIRIRTPQTNKLYLAHRLIYIYHNGNIEKGLQIDHMNRIKNDNRIENLRLTTQQENNFNRSNVKGYFWSKLHKKWLSKIKINGSAKFLGCFDKESDARQAYLNAKEKYHIIQSH